MNLFLAVFWLLLGVSLVTWQQLTGDRRYYLPLAGTEVSYAWLAFVLTVYNLVRYAGVRAARARRREAQLADALRERRDRSRDQTAPAGPPDPNFIFTDDPPRPPDPRLTDRPPPG
jgi:hypothetical protein